MNILESFDMIQWFFPLGELPPKAFQPIAIAMGTSGSRDTACFSGVGSTARRRADVQISPAEPMIVTVCGAAGQIGDLAEHGRSLMNTLVNVFFKQMLLLQGMIENWKAKRQRESRWGAGFKESWCVLVHWWTCLTLSRITLLVNSCNWHQYDGPVFYFVMFCCLRSQDIPSCQWSHLVVCLGHGGFPLQCLDLNIPEVMERTWTALEVEGMLVHDSWFTEGRLPPTRACKGQVGCAIPLIGRMIDALSHWPNAWSCFVLRAGNLI